MAMRSDGIVRRTIDGGMRMRLAFQGGELRVISVLAEEAGRVVELPGPMDVYDGGSLSRRLQTEAQNLYDTAMRIARETLADAYEAVAQEIEAFADEMQRLDEEAAAALERDLQDAEEWARGKAVEIAGSEDFRARAEAQEAIDKVQYEIEAAIRAGISHMRRDADDVYRQIIDEARNTGQTDWSTMRTSAQRALNAFAEQGVTGFTDRLGRRWGLPEYMDMAMRTGIQRASLAATISGMRHHGMDLCYVNAHKGCCGKCLKWQGVIMSLSGAPGYPSLAKAMEDGLFHPNCGHILQVYLEGYSHPGIGAPPEYTAEQNAELYAARQKQRYMERQLRKWKRTQAAAISPQDERIAQAHVRLWQRRIREHISDDIDLPRRYDREGGRVVLSDAAKKLKPLQIDENGGIISPEAAENRRKARTWIQSDAVVKTVNPEKQGRHIRGSDTYQDGRSYIYGTLETAQSLVDAHYGKGEPVFSRDGKWKNKEIIDTDEDIGVSIDPDTHAGEATNRFVIHYSKTGTHIVPVAKRK